MAPCRKLLLVNYCLSPWGGTETLVQHNYELLRQAGYEVTLYGTNKRPYFTEPLPYEELFAPHTNYDALPDLASKLRVALKPFYNQEAEALFDAFLDKVQPDLVHFHSIHWHLSPSLLNACLKRNLPMVKTLHESRHVCPAGTLMRGGTTFCQEALCSSKGLHNAVLHRCYEGSLSKSAFVAAEFAFRKWHGLYGKVGHYICPTQALADFVLNADLPRNKVSVVSNAVRDHWFAEPEEAPRRDYFLFAGRLSQEKGVHTLLEAIHLAGDNFPVLIAGVGPQEEALKEQCQRLGLQQVRFLGQLSQHQLKPLYQGAMATVMPFYWFENCPLTLMESLACGTPVIASNLAGPASMFRHGEHGYLIEPNSAQALAETLRRLASNPQLVARLGQAGREHARLCYNEKLHLEQLEQVYAKVLLKNGAIPMPPLPLGKNDSSQQVSALSSQDMMPLAKQ